MNDKHASITLDPVTFEVLKNSFITTVDQMAEQVLRTCYSFVIYNRDFSSALNDANGDSIAHIYLNSGLYDVQVTTIDSNGCSGICNTSVAIISTLSAGFYTNPENGCAPLDVSFFNTSSNAITYLWEFGDGTTSILENPTHTYANPGNYSVTLTAFGPTGSIYSVVNDQIAVLSSPLANIQAFPELITQSNDTVYFADNSLDAWSWDWDFGDPSSGSNNFSILQNPTHIYTENGNYTVSLVVTAANGCRDSISIPGFITVDIDSSASLSISGSKYENESFYVYPNPFGTTINVLIKSKTSSKISYNLYDFSGSKTISKSEYKPNYINETTTIEIPASKLTNGIYFLSIESESNRSLIKLVKSQ